MAEEETLPESMTISGFAINTAGPGNGLWFNHKQMSEVVGQEAHFVVDHDLSIKSIAGTVRFDHAVRTPIQVPTVKESDSPPVEEIATTLGFKANLSSMFNGYESVARNILALREQGRVPNVSVFVSGTEITYDEDTDRFFLEGPYQMRHLGQVDTGAFSDKVGVGVFEVQFSEQMNADTDLMTLGVPATLSHSGGVTPCAVQVCLSNQDDLIAKFAEEHGLDSPLLEKLGEAIHGKEELVDVSANSMAFGDLIGSTTLSNSFDASSMNLGAFVPTPFVKAPDSQESQPAEGPYKSADSSLTEGSSESNTEDKQMSDTTETPEMPEIQAAEVRGDPAPAEPHKGLSEEKVRDLLKAELNARDARIAALEEAKAEAESRALEASRTALATKMGLEDAAVLEGMSEAQLSLMAARFDDASKKPNTLPFSLSHMGFDHEDSPEAALKAKADEAAEWHAKRYLTKEDY